MDFRLAHITDSAAAGRAHDGGPEGGDGRTRVPAWSRTRHRLRNRERAATSPPRPRSRGRPDGFKVERLVAAFECGAIVNPDGLRNQVEGAIAQGLGGALFESIRFADGKILNGTMAEYRVPRFRDMPPIDITLIDRRDLPSAGAGETPIVCVAPAIGTAVRTSAPSTRRCRSRSRLRSASIVQGVRPGSRQRGPEPHLFNSGRRLDVRVLEARRDVGLGRAAHDVFLATYRQSGGLREPDLAVRGAGRALALWTWNTIASVPFTVSSGSR